MAKFITGVDLKNSLHDIIFNAEKILLLVSPYVKFDRKIQKLLEKHKTNDKLHIILVFGKNEDKAYKSLSKEDFDFLCNFPFVSIIYEPKLHAKYYGSDKGGLVTSINLHSYSMDNNIEFGVYDKVKFSDMFVRSSENEAFDEAWKITSGGQVVFIKRPVYKTKRTLGLINTGEEYKTSEILCNYGELYYSGGTEKIASLKRMEDFPWSLDIDKIDKFKSIEESLENEKGYCIRTGKRIPFNIERPLCYDAYKEWSKFSNKEYKEKYCHYSGELSNGETCFSKPILKKHWQSAKEKFNF